MIIHSSNDETVHMENGYSRYFEKFGKDDRFVFKLYSDRGHAYPVNSEAGETYIKTHMERKDCMELDVPLMLEILDMFHQ